MFTFSCWSNIILGGEDSRVHKIMASVTCVIRIANLFTSVFPRAGIGITCQFARRNLGFCLRSFQTWNINDLAVTLDSVRLKGILNRHLLCPLVLTFSCCLHNQLGMHGVSMTSLLSMGSLIDWT